VADDARFSDLLKNTPGGCVITEEGVVLSANLDSVSITGIPRNHLVGAPLGELVVPEHTGFINQAMHEAGPGLTTRTARLNHGFRPMEFSFRRIADRLVAVGIRAMETEHAFSAAAGGDLTHDPVTNLPNRYHLLETLDRKLSNAGPEPLAMIAVWIDELSTLTLERGARVADRVCRQVGERVLGRLRGPDLLGRFDDNCFVAVLHTDSDLDHLAEIGDRLRSEVVFPVEFDGTLVSFTASVMVASVGHQRPSVQKVLSRLEIVGRRAAASGGNSTDILTL
jgi:diguanylate cyclase (GGDEF)-like protein